jgi:pimeloyl-ACP methyl ester carboxylesterase
LQALSRELEIRAPALGPLRDGRMPSGEWRVWAQDLLQALAGCPSPVPAAGHSLGAVALLLAATMRPDRFDRLLLLDPVAMPVWGCRLLQWLPAGWRARGPLARAARRRRERWPDAASAWAETRARRWFAGVPDPALRLLLDDALEPGDPGLRLRFRGAWEARLYESPVSVWPLLSGPLPPITVLHGVTSRLFNAADARRWQRLRPQDAVRAVPGAGHLLPLERPAEVAAAMSAWLGV